LRSPRQLSVATESWPVFQKFATSREAVTWVDLVTVEILHHEARGRGECRPYPRYGETPEAVVASIEAVRTSLEGGDDPAALVARISTSAGRNAVDCALWDLQAKLSQRPVWALAGLPPPGPVTTAYTLSLDSPDAMAAAARREAGRPLLKVKLGAEGVAARLAAVREAAPSARLVVDANEAWSPSDLPRLFDLCVEAGVEMVEQPLPAGEDEVLGWIRRPIPVCADESIHGISSLDHCAGKYDLVNIKLDKTGGLTEALGLLRAAKARGLGVMVGCMVSTSLSIAPAHLVAQEADLADLDGPLLLTRDRPDGIRFVGSMAYPASREFWG
jgi:L-alanine-DL-glutamate epimerase-like enolase superfamily enzyme